jgi:hypothetical protein
MLTGTDEQHSREGGEGKIQQLEMNDVLVDLNHSIMVRTVRSPTTVVVVVEEEGDHKR